MTDNKPPAKADTPLWPEPWPEVPHTRRPGARPMNIGIVHPIDPADFWRMPPGLMDLFSRRRQPSRR